MTTEAGSGATGTLEIRWPDEMSEAERATLREVLTAYDAALTELENDRQAIFASDSERNRIFYGFLKRWEKAWSKPGPCMHAGCTNPSIARSHTISLGTSIRLIAENGHVLTPRFGENGLELVSVGVNEASTFPGFCTQHETQFSVFENQKQMTQDEHFRLQAFRTVCREIYSRKHQQQKSQTMLAEYRCLRDGFVAQRLQAVSTSADPLNVSSIKFENDETDQKLVDLLSQIQGDLGELQALYDGILNDMRNGGDTVAIQVRALDLRLPVCLSGLGVLNYGRHGTRHRALCFIVILPEADRTIFMIGADRRHADDVASHLGDDGSFAILATLESWMIHGSDHWFMMPSAWAAIPHARQQAICERILEPLSLSDRAPFSVLDGPRQQMLSYLSTTLMTGRIQTGDREIYENLRADEQAKLNWLPEPASS